ncbi:MAG: hypothetical protein ACRENC_18830, partial [Gemmatimonadaceae bacterium]
RFGHAPRFRGAGRPVTLQTTVVDAGHPESCPWCGQRRIHGVSPSASGDRHFRCVACGTTFFIHEFSQQHAERSPLCPPASIPTQRAARIKR